MFNARFSRVSGHYQPSLSSPKGANKRRRTEARAVMRATMRRLRSSSGPFNSRSRSGNVAGQDSGRDAAVGAHNLAGAFLNGGWQRFGFVLFAIGDNFFGILLQAVVVQNIIICSRVIVAAHEIPYEISVC